MNDSSSSDLEGSIDGLAFGNDYVEFESKLLVRGAARTLSAFKAGKKHATTLSYRINQRGIAITSSQRVKDAFEAACAAHGGIVYFNKEGAVVAETNDWNECDISENLWYDMIC